MINIRKIERIYSVIMIMLSLIGFWLLFDFEYGVIILLSFQLFSIFAFWFYFYLKRIIFFTELSFFSFDTIFPTILFFILLFLCYYMGFSKKDLPVFILLLHIIIRSIFPIFKRVAYTTPNKKIFIEKFKKWLDLSSIMDIQKKNKEVVICTQNEQFILLISDEKEQNRFIQYWQEHKN